MAKSPRHQKAHAKWLRKPKGERRRYHIFRAAKKAARGK